MTVTEKPGLYTCIGKGGIYEEVGVATGAGPQRGVGIVVYRSVPDGVLYWRHLEDFATRMQLIEGQP